MLFMESDSQKKKKKKKEKKKKLFVESNELAHSLAN